MTFKWYATWLIHDHALAALVVRPGLAGQKQGLALML
jgi:hypothetical protein